MEKLSILVPESRNVFGVCDPLGLLQYGECFFRPYIRGQPTTLSGEVLVAKNPCYLFGDVRRLTSIANDRVKGLEHLVDCIVFPTCGKRPHPMEIAGSDLDGDQYFICWDADYNWCFLFHLNSDQIRWDYLLRAVQDYSESLLVIHVHDIISE